MAYCGSAALVGMDKHGNKNNGCRYTADISGENVGLLPGKKFIALRMFWS